MNGENNTEINKNHQINNSGNISEIVALWKKIYVTLGSCFMLENVYTKFVRKFNRVFVFDVKLAHKNSTDLKYLHFRYKWAVIVVLLLILQICIFDQTFVCVLKYLVLLNVIPDFTFLLQHFIQYKIFVDSKMRCN